ncbi:DUF5658 family protein [uncultured Paludibaculum sp.]|uniref:DUF5658 family protein n=1 Tax=uncultured Paludibaculum sp. TaxID=1765020 RepID=UPI002AAC2E6D|nr:DUF5658 family protein [uncultured Paludibaculum sp.]
MASATQQLSMTRPVPNATGQLLQFTYLQGLDTLTTLAFLLAGAKEANPLVRTMMALFGNPLLGLVAVKLGAMLLGVYCWNLGKVAVLRRANLFFAVLVAWNLVCLLLALGVRWNP